MILFYKLLLRLYFKTGQLGLYLNQSRHFLFKCPWSTNHASSSASSARIWRPNSALRLAAARLSLEYLRCVVQAAVRRARSSYVLGPVDLPPCREQRPLRLYAGLWQGVPFQVLAPHRWPGQSGPTVPWDTLLKVAICHAENSASYWVSLYPIIGRGVRVG